MGLLYSSCCGRRKKINDEERSPLLSAPSDSLSPPRSPLEYLADVLAALRTGKLPSQKQLELVLLRLKHSGAFNFDARGAAVGQNVPLAGEELQKVLDDANDVLEAVLRVGSEKNYDNRVQDLVYNTRKLSKPVYVTSLGEVRVDAPTSGIETIASAIPSRDDVALDAAALVSSLRDIIFLTLSSSAFRLIFSDLFNIAREFVAYGAERVKVAASVVQNVAETVEADMRPADTVDSDIHVPQEPLSEPISVKETLLGRVESILRQAQASPKHNAALRTLLFLSRKYAFRLKMATDVLSQASNERNIEVLLPIIIPDPRFSRVVEDLKVLVERFAGGQSLDPALTTLSEFVNTVYKTADDRQPSEVQHFFDEVGEWLDHTLTDNQFASSRAGRDLASKLFDDGQNLISQNADLSGKWNQLVEELDKFCDAVVSDKATITLVNALDTLRKDVALFLEETSKRGRRAAEHRRTALIQTSIGWLLPHVLRLINTIPLPRVEYVQRRGDLTQLAVALDALVLEAEEALLPDVFQFQEWVEVRVELDETLGAAELTNPNARLIRENGTLQDLNNPSESTPLLASISGTQETTTNTKIQQEGRKRARVHSTSRVRVHVEGLRLAVRDVGYYAMYNATRWIGYADEGLASAEIGRSGNRGQGLSLDIELEIDSDAYGSLNTRDTATRPLYRVTDVRSELPGLVLRLTKSRHWILNAMLSTFAGPVGRLVAPRILNSQIQTALEKLEEVSRELKCSAEKKVLERNNAFSDGDDKKVAGFSEWWSAILERFGKDGEDSDEASDDETENEFESGETEVYIESSTQVGLKGVVHRSIAQPEPSPQADEDTVPPTEESAFAIGVGAQLLPGHGEPTDVHRAAPSEVVTAAATQVGKAGDAVKDTAEEVRVVGERSVKMVVDTRREIEEAEGRLEVREAVERRGRGWRSKAFDLS